MCVELGFGYNVEGFHTSPNIIAIYPGRTRAWKYMYKDIGSGIHVVSRPIEYRYAFYGCINSIPFLSLDDKATFAEFMQYSGLADYHPVTHICRTVADINNLQLLDRSSVIFVKEATASTFGGHGIEIFNNLSAVQQYLASRIPGKHYVVQDDATQGHPLLYDGRKGDFRFYLFLTIRNGALEAFLYRDGFLKQAPELYNNDISKRALLTNNTQRNDVVLDNKLVSELHDGQRVFSTTKEVLTKLVKALKTRISQSIQNSNRLQIQITGSDLMFDSAYRPYILEMNINNPAYYVKNNNSQIRELKRTIGQDLVDNFVRSYFHDGNFNTGESGFIPLDL